MPAMFNGSWKVHRIAHAETSARRSYGKTLCGRVGLLVKNRRFTVDCKLCLKKIAEKGGR